MPVVSENIVAEIAKRLTDYEVSAEPVFVNVYRETKAPGRFTPLDYQVVVKAQNPVRVPEHDCHGNPPALAYRLDVGCFGNVMVSETGVDSIESRQMEIAGDIVKAITSAATWWRMANNAFNSTIGDVSLLGSDGYHSGAVTVSCFYRVSENDPSTVRS